MVASKLESEGHRELPSVHPGAGAGLLFLPRCLRLAAMHAMTATTRGGWGAVQGVTEPPNYDGPHKPVMVIMTSNSRTYVPHNLKGLLSSE
jgi:hypothetical protein